MTSGTKLGSDVLPVSVLPAEIFLAVLIVLIAVLWAIQHIRQQR